MPLLGSNNNLDVTVSTSADTSGLKQAQQGIQSLNQTADEGSSKVGGLSGIFSSFGSTLKAVGEAFISYQLVNQVEQFFSSIISSAGGLEQTNIAFQGMIGNVQEANSVFGQLVQYANVTPFQAADIENAARTLLSFGTAGQQTVDIVKQLGDVAAVSGSNIGDIARVAGEVFSQGDFNARNLLELVHDGGGGLVKIMAANAGGMQNLRNEMQKGKVTAQQFLDAVTEATSKGGYAFEGANREALTFNGRLSTLRDAATMAGLALIGIKLDPQLGLQIQPGGIFDQMKGGIAGITVALNGLQPRLQIVIPEFINGVKGLWQQITQYLGPSFQALWNTITTQLIPALSNFWHQIIQPLIPVLGGALVAALYLAVNALNDLLKIVTPVMNFLSSHTWVVTALAGAFLALKAAMMLQAGFAAVQGGIALLTGTAIPSLIASIGAASATWVAAFPIAGILVDIALVAKAIQTVMGAYSALKQASAAAASDKASVEAAHQQLLALSKNGTADQKARANKLLAQGYATGVSNYSGGLALVGENGPELVGLPQGSSVYTNSQSQAMMRGVTNNKTVHIQQVILNTPAAASRFFQELDQDTINIGKGLTTNRGMAA